MTDRPSSLATVHAGCGPRCRPERAPAADRLARVVRAALVAGAACALSCSADRDGADRAGPTADRTGPTVDRAGPTADRAGPTVDRTGTTTARTAAGEGPSGAAGPIFTDVTAAAGIDFVHVCGARGEYWLPEEIGAGGALLDYDGDGDLDLYLVQSGVIGEETGEHRNRLYRNDGAGHFEDVSRGSGADIGGYGMGAAAADHDRDGDVDLYITRLGPNALLRNDGDGTFTDVTAAAGVGDPGFGASAAFFDYDRDGHLDLYVANYVDWTAEREGACYDARGLRDYCNPMEYEAPSVDRLYHATGDGRFEDVTEPAGIAAARGNGLGLACSDFNGDGWIDVYVANDQTPGFLWVNQGDGTFVEDAAFSGCAFNEDGVAIAGMGVAAEDLDGDGDFDLVVTNIHDQAHLGLRNDGGRFRDVTHRWGLDGWGVPYTGFGIGLFDQDHDGMLDGFVVNGAVNLLAEPPRPGHLYAEPDQFIRRDGGGRFRDASAEAGAALRPYEMGRGVLMGDVDNDGDIDLCVTSNRGPARLLRNDNGSGLAWTVLDLRPAAGGRHALNARVAVRAGGRTQHREVRPHAGYLGSNDPRVHLGLGDVAVIDSVRVTWPDGSTEAWTDVPVRRHLTLRQGTAPEIVETLPRSD